MKTAGTKYFSLPGMHLRLRLGPFFLTRLRFIAPQLLKHACLLGFVLSFLFSVWFILSPAEG